MQILIANSFPFSFFTFRLTVVIIWKPFWIQHVIKGNFMQTIKENFKAVSEGNAGLPLGPRKLERSLLLIFLLSVPLFTEVLAALQRTAKGAKISSCWDTQGTGWAGGRVTVHQWLALHFSSFVRIPDKTEGWWGILETGIGLTSYHHVPPPHLAGCVASLLWTSVSSPVGG